VIIGVGTDLCQVQRMAQLLDDSTFLRRYFEQAEQAYILARGAFAAQSMAGHFAAKEAFVKALGAGFDGIRPEDIVIAHKPGGAPYYDLRQSALDAARLAGVRRAHLSITHDGGLAGAFCILEGECTPL
jgi:holo-[acyl-carrier protein] synthase